MHSVLRAACSRQGVACFECSQRQLQTWPGNIATLSNVKLCKAPECAIGFPAYARQKRLIEREGSGDGLWPSRSAYPELYR